MPETKKLQWHQAAGGTAAAPGKHSYTAYPEGSRAGGYYIWPVSTVTGRHAGYAVNYANSGGLLPGGLWHSLSRRAVSLAAARGLCARHYEEHVAPALAAAQAPPPAVLFTAAALGLIG